MKVSFTLFCYVGGMNSLLAPGVSSIDVERPSGDLADLLTTVVGMLLPLLAALLYRTYAIAVTPAWLESSRQLGYVWLASELCLILWARARGFTVGGTWRMLSRRSRTCLALFLATFWLSSVSQSHYPAISLAHCIAWIIHLIFAGALFHLARAIAPGRLAAAWPGFALGLVALTIVIAIHFTCLPVTIRGQERTVDWAMAIPGFISARLFGAWCGAVLALLTGVAWRAIGDARAQRWLHLGVALAFGLTLWTTTRGALLAWGGVVPIAWFVAGAPRSRAATRALPLYLLVAAAAVLLLPLQPYGDRAYTFFEASNVGSVNQFSSGRLTIWRLALAAAWQHPWFGNGAGSCWWLVWIGGAYPHHVQPHNALVQFLLDWGIVPTLAALALLGDAIRTAHRRARRNRDLLPWLLMLDALLLMSMVDGMLYFAQFILLIFGCLAICLASGTIESSAAPHRTRSARRRRRSETVVEPAALA